MDTVTRIAIIALIGGVMITTSCSRSYDFRPEPRPQPLVAASDASLADTAVPLANAARVAGASEDPATGPLRMSLSEVVARALSSSLDRTLASAEEEVSRARAKAAFEELAPSIEFGGGVRNVDGQVQGSFGDLRHVNFNGVNPQAAVVLDTNILETYHRSIAARRSVDRAVYHRLDVEQRLMLRVVELYENIVLAKAGLRVAQELIANSDRFVMLATARRDGGTGRAADVPLAETQLARYRTIQVRMRQEWWRQSIALASVLRISHDRLIEPSEDALRPRSLSPPSEWDATAAARKRPDVEAAGAAINEAEAERDAALWSLLGPRLFAEARGSYIGRQWNNLDRQTALGFFLGWSLSFSKVSRLEARRAAVEVSRVRRLKLEEQAVAEVAKARREIVAARETVGLTQTSRDAARKSLRISNALFESGNTLAIEVLQAENAVAQTEQSLAAAIVDYNLAQVRLLTAAGVLNAAMFTPKAGGTSSTDVFDPRD